jgi:diguanylate cyclase (GGDEF)-like protein
VQRVKGEQMRADLVISMIFFITFIIYGYIGIYALNLNSKFLVNRLFFIMCLLFSLWAFSFSIANSAVDYETALFWRRTASMGWGTVYSVLLHFILALTGRKKILKLKWIYYCIYLPALTNVFIFSWYNNIAIHQYNLVYTIAGWTNIQINNGFDWFFNAYYIGFVFSALLILFLWGKKSSDLKKIKQRNLLISSFAIALVVGTITDIVANNYLENAVPQMAPVVLLIPISTIFYSIKKYGFMSSNVETTEHQNGKILDSLNRIKLFRNLTILFVCGSILNFMSQYFINGKDLKDTLLFSGILIAMGLLIQLILRLRIGKNKQDFIVSMIMIISIIIITLKFIKNASVSVWSISFLLIILSVVFSKKRLIYLLCILLVSIQILVWIINPHEIVEINYADYIVRITILCFTIWISLFINGIYTKKLKENEEQIRFQKMQLEISSEFSNVTELNINNKINIMLRTIGEHEDVDYVSFSNFEKEFTTINVINEWKDDGIEKQNKVVSVESLPWIVEEILNNRIILIPDIKNFHTEKGEDEKSLDKEFIKSIIYIPIRNNEEVISILRIEAIKTKKDWNDDYQKRFRILSNYLTNALIKVDSEKEIKYLAYNDTLTGLPNRVFFKNQLDKEISLSSRNENFIAVVFLDLDSFKSVNDTIGHKGGDELLRQVAHNLANSIRKYDVVSRFGGDEFLIMFPQISDLDDVEKMIDKLMKVFIKPMNINC